MQTSTTTATFDFASLSKEALAKIVALGSRLGLTPEEALKMAVEKYNPPMASLTPTPKKSA